MNSNVLLRLFFCKKESVRLDSEDPKLQGQLRTVETGKHHPPHWPLGELPVALGMVWANRWLNSYSYYGFGPAFFDVFLVL